MIGLHFENFEFYSPWFFLLFVLFVPLILKEAEVRKVSGVKISSIEGMRGGNFSPTLFFLKISKYVILSAIIIALARPRMKDVSKNFHEDQGIDIILSVDISHSMLSKDLVPDRLGALKKIAHDFIEKRINDRIGLVVYSGEAFLKVPLTRNHFMIQEAIKELDPNQLNPGTTIGEALAVAAKHLKREKTKSKIIILMTDGVQTIKNSLDPFLAAKLAKKNKIKVYTIGIGSNGYALTPTSIDPLSGKLFFSREKVEIDEETLKHIAKTTEGKYFRAISNDSLEQVYEEINNLEISNFESQLLSYHYVEYFRYFLWIAFVMLFIDALLRWVIFKIFD